MRFDRSGMYIHNPHGNQIIPVRARTHRYPLVGRHAMLWIWMREEFPPMLVALLLTVIVMAMYGVPALREADKTRIDAPYLANPEAFAFELIGNDASKPVDVWVDDWFFRAKPPANARLLAKLPIYATYRAARSWGVAPLAAFFDSYRCWTAVFLFAFLLLGARCCATAARHVAPTAVTATGALEIVAMCALAALPPVLFACKFPIHGSPNDLLGYALIAAAMNALFSGNLARYVMFALSGIACRETNLITLLPLLILGPGSVRARAITAFAIVALSAVFHTVVGGTYDPLAGARHNWEFPWESAGFVYLTFGPLWLTAAFYGLRAAQRPENSGARRFLLCAALSLPLVLAVVVGLARVREIRILFVLYIYVVPLGLLGIHHFLATMTCARRALLIGAFLLGVAVTFRLYVTLLPVDATDFARKADALSSLYGGFGGGWQAEFLAYFLLAVPALAIGLSMGWVGATVRRRS